MIRMFDTDTFTLLAAHALALNATLVTHNTREFRRVPDLDVADWVLDDH